MAWFAMTSTRMDARPVLTQRGTDIARVRRRLPRPPARPCRADRLGSPGRAVLALWRLGWPLSQVRPDTELIPGLGNVDERAPYVDLDVRVPAAGDPKASASCPTAPSTDMKKPRPQGRGSSTRRGN